LSVKYPQPAERLSLKSKKQLSDSPVPPRRTTSKQTENIQSEENGNDRKINSFG